MAVSLPEPAWVPVKRVILTVVTPWIRIASRITLLCIVGALTLGSPAAWAQSEDAGAATDGGWQLWVGGGVVSMVTVGILALVIRRIRKS